MVDLRGALSGAVSGAGSGLAWMGHEAAAGAQAAAHGLGAGLASLDAASHRANVSEQGEYLARDLRAHGVPEADAWSLGHSMAQSLDVNTPEKRTAALAIALRQYRTEIRRHGPG